MEDYEVILNAIMAHLNPEDVPNDDSIPVGISNRHIHLSQAALEKLFGNHYQLTKLKDLSQPGQYACKECVTLAGPKGVIEKVRIRSCESRNASRNFTKRYVQTWSKGCVTVIW